LLFSYIRIAYESPQFATYILLLYIIIVKAQVPTFFIFLLPEITKDVYILL